MMGSNYTSPYYNNVNSSPERRTLYSFAGDRLNGSVSSKEMITNHNSELFHSYLSNSKLSASNYSSGRDYSDTRNISLSSGLDGVSRLSSSVYNSSPNYSFRPTLSPKAKDISFGNLQSSPSKSPVHHSKVLSPSVSHLVASHNERMARIEAKRIHASSDFVLKSPATNISRTNRNYDDYHMLKSETHDPAVFGPPRDVLLRSTHGIAPRTTHLSKFADQYRGTYNHAGGGGYHSKPALIPAPPLGSSSLKTTSSYSSLIKSKNDMFSAPRILLQSPSLYPDGLSDSSLTSATFSDKNKGRNIVSADLNFINPLGTVAEAYLNKRRNLQTTFSLSTEAGTSVGDKLSKTNAENTTEILISGLRKVSSLGSRDNSSLSHSGGASSPPTISAALVPPGGGVPHYLRHVGSKIASNVRFHKRQFSLSRRDSDISPSDSNDGIVVSHEEDVVMETVDSNADDAGPSLPWSPTGTALLPRSSEEKVSVTYISAPSCSDETTGLLSPSNDVLGGRSSELEGKHEAEMLREGDVVQELEFSSPPLNVDSVSADVVSVTVVNESFHHDASFDLDNLEQDNRISDSSDKSPSQDGVVEELASLVLDTPEPLLEVEESSTIFQSKLEVIDDAIGEGGSGVTFVLLEKEFDGDAEELTPQKSLPHIISNSPPLAPVEEVNSKADNTDTVQAISWTFEDSAETGALIAQQLLSGVGSNKIDIDIPLKEVRTTKRGSPSKHSKNRIENQ